MPIDFPASPNTNDTYSYGGTIWIWNGNVWIIQSTSIGSTGPKGLQEAPLQYQLQVIQLRELHHSTQLILVFLRLVM